MKFLYKFSIVVLFLFMNMALGQAQNAKIQTDTLTVNGVCEMCKKRIEKAAFIKGVKMAEWDKYAQKLTVIYKTKKTSADLICRSVADAGHDTDKIKATDEAYGQLPDCCAYRDEALEVH